MATLAITYLLTGAICAALSIPLIRGQVPMNHWYGVRIAKAFESDTHWYALNRFGGRQLLGYSLAVALFGAALFFLPIAKEHWSFWLVLVAPVLLLVPVVTRIMAYARRFDPPNDTAI